MFENRLLVMLRFTIFSLWLILISLLVPDFQPGGRYLILLYALLAALGCGMIRTRTSGLRCRARGLLGGLGMFPAWLIIKLLSPGMHPDWAGMFLAYLGFSLIEMSLPNGIKELSKKT